MDYSMGLFVYYFGTKKTYDDIIDDKNFFNKTFSWDVKGDTRESSIWGLINDFYMKQLMFLLEKTKNNT